MSSPQQDRSGTLRDQDITVERTLGRRSFLAATGLLLGTAALASGCTDPDRHRVPAPARGDADREAREHHDAHPDPDPHREPPPPPRP